MAYQKNWEEFLRETVRRYSSPEQFKSDPHRISFGKSFLTIRNDRCGDSVELSRTAAGGIALHSRGCAICRAATVLAQEYIDLRADQPLPIRRMAKAMITMIEGKDATPITQLISETDLAHRLQMFLLLADYPGRQRCGTLVWEALLEAQYVDTDSIID